MWPVLNVDFNILFEKLHLSYRYENLNVQILGYQSPPQYTLQMFAGIYWDFAGKSECGDFKFTGIACIPAIPVIFEVNQKKVWTFYIYSSLRFFKFPYNFCGDFRRRRT